MEDGVIQLSVVIADRAAEGSTRSLEAVLRAIDHACMGLKRELLVVGDQALLDQGTLGLPGPAVRRITLPSGTLTPVLWGAGASAARGRVVAFTTTQMLVADGWGRALLGAIRGDVVGAAGAIGLGRGADGASAALFFVRFSAFLPESVLAGGTIMRDIPGDNAAYLRSAISDHGDLLAEGFWEVEFHRRFERDGLSLRLLPNAEATMTGPIDFGAAVRQRFEHATEFGGSRVGRHGESALRVLMSSPLVPFLLVLRIGRRVLPYVPYRARFVLSLPWLMVLSMAWAFGEAVGAVRAGQGGVGRAP